MTFPQTFQPRTYEAKREQMMLSRMSDAIPVDNVEFSERRDHISLSMIHELRARLLSRDVELQTLPPQKLSTETTESVDEELRTPATWWDHLKLTFARWAGVKAWRLPLSIHAVIADMGWLNPTITWKIHARIVRRTTTTLMQQNIIKRHMCPHVVTAPHETHLRWMANLDPPALSYGPV
jgi:hypothetical protein